MSANTRKFTITDTSDSSPIIAASDSREVVLRNSGDSRVYFGFNGAVSTDGDGCFGLYIGPGEWITFDKLKSDSDIYARTNSEETSTLMGEIY